MRAAVVAFGMQSALFPASASSAPLHPMCHNIAVSPEFARDRTALCGRVSFDGTAMAVSVFRTRDGGRTWALARGTGLLTDATTTFSIQPQFSPEFAKDRRIFVATSSGLFVTTDLAETFTIVDSGLPWAGLDNPGIYLGEAGALSQLMPGRRVFAASGAGIRAARLDVVSGTHQPVVGVGPAKTRQFVLPGSAASGTPVLAVSAEQPDPTKPDFAYSLWACTDDLVCAERQYTFEPGYQPVRFWRIPLSGGRSDLGVLLGRGSSYRAMLSSDNGLTFRRWTSLDAAVAPMVKAMGPSRLPSLGLAMNQAKPGRLFLRVVGDKRLGEANWRHGSPPREQVFRSDNGGGTWRRVAYGLGYEQPGGRGAIPWNSPVPGITADWAAIAMASDGRLLVPAAREGASGIGSTAVYCSVDGGVRWHSACPY